MDHSDAVQDQWNLDEVDAAGHDYWDRLGSDETRRRRVGQRRRAAGAIVGMAVGDALGAPYEFGPSPHITLAGTAADMVGGGRFGWEPGEWTDDTSMAVPLLRALAAEGHPASSDTLEQVAREWREWARTAPDVGNQTRAVLSQLRPDATVADAQAAARAVHERAGKSGGNGSLMRTAPVGIIHVVAPSGLVSPPRAITAVVEGARSVSDLTHYDVDAGDACVLWSVMIHMAVTNGVVDVEDALRCLPATRRGRWEELLADAADADPGDFPRNGWVVHAIQAAWAAIHRAGFKVEDESTATPESFGLAVQHAINAGGDTDTVAAITGGLAGALVGVDAIPLGWQRVLHGWGGVGEPVLRGSGLVKLASDAHANAGRDPYGYARTERVNYSSWPETNVLVRHPHDPGVFLGGVGVLDHLPDAVDAVVSLCRVGWSQVPARVPAADRVEVWLVDREEAEENPHLDFVLAEAADAVAALRAEGKTVLLHCVQAQSRTPAVALAYAKRCLGVASEKAIFAVSDALGGSIQNAVLAAASSRLTAKSG